MIVYTCTSLFHIVRFEGIYRHCLFHHFCICSHNIHSLSNCIHAHLIKAIGHEDKIGAAEPKLCNEQKQIHSESIMSCELIV